MPRNRADSSSPPDLARFVGRCMVVGMGLCLLGAVGSTLWLAGPQAFRACGRFPWWLFVGLGALIGVAWLCMGTRLYLLAHSAGYPISWWRAVGTALSIELGVLTSPGGTGGTAIRFALLHRSGVPLSGVTAMYAAEWLADALFFLLLSPFAVYVVWHDPSWRQLAPVNHPSLRSLLWAVAGVLVLGSVVYTARRWLRRVWRRPLARLSFRPHWRLPARLRLLGRSLRRACREAREIGGDMLRKRRRTLLLTMVLTSGQWLCRYGVLPTVLWALGTSRNPLPLILLQGVVAMLVMASALPGGGGTMEVMGTMLLAHFVTRPDAVVAMLVWRLFTYHAYVLGGGGALAMCLRRGGPTARPGRRERGR